MHANRRAFCTQKYIGFFDSGIGGLTLLAECVRRMPEERFIYLGDNDRAPYGNRPQREIKEFVFQGFSLLSAYPLKGGVIACNTATAVAAEALRETVPFPVLGVEPAVRPALLSGAERVLVLATRATVCGAVCPLRGQNFGLCAGASRACDRGTYFYAGRNRSSPAFAQTALRRRRARLYPLHFSSQGDRCLLRLPYL